MERPVPLRALAFGQRWYSELALPLFHPAEEGSDTLPEDARAITVRRVDALSERTMLPAHRTRHVRQATDGFRYRDSSATVLDVYESGRIDVVMAAVTAAESPDALPSGFFGTVAGLLLALWGKVPIHGSAVEVDGQAVLLCGRSGAGKSTGAAALIARGARLISDDLSVLTLVEGAPHLFAGRRTLRLFADVGGFLGEQVSWQAEPFVSAGKLAVQPPSVSPARAIPLRTVVILGGEARPEAEKAAVLAGQLYRPAWMKALPGEAERLAMLAAAATQLRVMTHRRVEARSRQALLEEGRELLGRLL